MRELLYFNRFGLELFVGLYDEPATSHWHGGGCVWRRLVVSWAASWRDCAVKP